MPSGAAQSRQRLTSANKPPREGWRKAARQKAALAGVQADGGHEKSSRDPSSLPASSRPGLLVRLATQFGLRFPIQHGTH